MIRKTAPLLLEDADGETLSSKCRKGVAQAARAYNERLRALRVVDGRRKKGSQLLKDTPTRELNDRLL